MNPYLLVRLIRLSFAIIIIGILFKIMHWPYSQALLTLGVGIIVILYPVRFYFKKEKKLIDYIKLLLLIIFPLVWYLRLFHLPFPYFFSPISAILFISWIVLELYQIYKGENTKNSFSVFPFDIQTLIIGIILLGAFFNLWHYPQANYVLIVGVLFLFAYFIIDTFKQKK